MSNCWSPWIQGKTGWLKNPRSEIGRYGGRFCRVHVPNPGAAVEVGARECFPCSQQNLIETKQLIKSENVQNREEKRTDFQSRTCTHLHKSSHRSRTQGCTRACTLGRRIFRKQPVQTKTSKQKTHYTTLTPPPNRTDKLVIHPPPVIFRGLERHLFLPKLEEK